jgi:AP-3 complex subunit delta
LVALHSDVILDCIDDPDVTIRLRALDLVVGMVNSDTLNSVVGRLMRQLRLSPILSSVDNPMTDQPSPHGLEPAADSDDENPEESLKPVAAKGSDLPPLPEEYRVKAISVILQVCSMDMYANISDFEWYIDVLVQLVRLAPSQSGPVSLSDDLETKVEDVSRQIGLELRNVAVRVKSVRGDATRAAEGLVLANIASGSNMTALGPVVWIVGEYCDFLDNAENTLTTLLHSPVINVPHDVLSTHIQAVIKLFSSITGSDRHLWTAERKVMVSLLTARVIHFMESLATHPNLEVQERAVEYLELMRLTAEAIAGHEPRGDGSEDADPPLILTQAVPALFIGQELNAVAPGAQKKVSAPNGLDLDTPINPNLESLLLSSDSVSMASADEDEYDIYYHQPPAVIPTVDEPAANKLKETTSKSQSYQQEGDESYLDPDIIARRRAERRERNKDDPFYIPSGDSASGTSTPIHSILKNSNGEVLDIDSIPIMKLDLKGVDAGGSASNAPTKRKVKKKVHIERDENIIGDELQTSQDDPRAAFGKKSNGKKSFLQVDSSGLSALSLEEDGPVVDYRGQQQEEEDMAKAMKEVERLRLEMQRASERIEAKGVPDGGTLIKKKKKKVKVQPKVEGATEEAAAPEETAVKKKKKRPKVEGAEVKSTKKKGKSKVTLGEQSSIPPTLDS